MIAPSSPNVRVAAPRPPVTIGAGPLVDCSLPHGHVTLKGSDIGRGNRRHVVVREVINGLMYILSTGCQWRAIPKDLPPRSTLYDYFDLWSWDGTLDRIHDALYAQCREAASREASPTAAIIDSQSVKSAEKGGLRLIRRAMMQARRSRARSGTSSSIRRAC